MLPYETEKRLEAVLSALEKYSLDADPKHLVTVGQEIMVDLHLPRHDPYIEVVCSHPHTVRLFGEALVRTHQVPLKDSKDPLTRRIRDILWQAPSDEYQLRIRRFLPEGGYYYAYPLFIADSAYAILNAQPILITPITADWGKELTLETELGLLTRPEVRLIATMFFSLYSWHGPLFYFLFGPETVDLPASLFTPSPQHLEPQILPQLATALEVVDRISRLQDPQSMPGASRHSPFQYRPQQLNQERAVLFHSLFSLQDDLALRTAFLLLKSASLWTYGGHIFGEEATANLFFGLEGCLHLIHRRIAGEANFVFKPVLGHIESTFPEKPGYAGMIEDAYDKRIQIVHPEPRQGIGWLPNIYADDFYENYGMANDLLYYSITGSKLPEDDL